MAFQTKYKSRWTGQQIDDGIDKVRSSSSTPSAENIAKYNANGNLETGKPQSNSEAVRLQDVSNPNLLVNGDFRVNQRGLPSYDAGNGAMYCVDHWWLSQAVFTVATKSLTTTSSWRGMLQYIENWEVLKGKTVTASIKATSGASGVRFGVKNGNTDLAYVDGLVNSSGILTVSFAIPSNASYNDFRVALWNKGAETTTIEYIKLELGEVATNFCPRPYSEELAICQMPFDGSGISTVFSNPNLLVNGDFQVNQRGKSSWVTVGGIYTVDKWYISGGHSSLNYSNGNMTFVGASAYDYFIQYVDPTKLKLWGKTVTMSCEFDDGKILKSTGTFPNSFSSATGVVPTSEGYKGLNLRGYLYSATQFGFTIDVSPTANGTIKWCKLELGDLSTKFVPKAYEEELAACQMPYNNGISTSYSNPNLLINGDFKINQRGQTTYTGNTYGVDRWLGVQASTIVTKISNGISVSLTAQYSKVRQLVQNYEYLKGKQVTISAKISNYVRNKTYHTVFEISDGVNENIRVILSNGIITATGTINANATKVEVSFYNYSNDANTDTFDVEWAKLEVGSIATQFIPKSYEEELSLCQMPYPASVSDNGTAYSGSFINPNLLINGDLSVNQRGLTTYSGANKYTVDRWQQGDGSFDVSTKTWTAKTQYAGFVQKIEDVEKYKGKTITISAYVTGCSTGGVFDILINDGSNHRSSIALTSGFTGLKTFTYTVSSTATQLRVGFIYLGTATTDTLSFDWFKMEMGSIATPFVPRPYAEEFALCQRYYQTIYLMEFGFLMFPRTTDTMRAQIIYDTEMRVQPTISQVAGKTISTYQIDTLATYAQSAIGFTTLTSGLRNAIITLSNFSGLTMGKIYSTQLPNGVMFTLDAEL